MSEELAAPIEVPVEALSDETLTAVIESFILREATDYGREELSHETKVLRLRKQLAKAEIKLIFDANTESITFITQKDWAKLRP